MGKILSSCRRRDSQDSLRLDRTLTEIKPVFTLPLLFNSSDVVFAGTFGDPETTGDGTSSISLKVSRGDTLDRMFRRAGLDIGQLAEIMRLGPARESLRILRPGDAVTVRHDSGSILEMTRQLDPFKTLQVTRTVDGFDAQVAALDYQTRSMRTAGEIRSSLFEAAGDAGVSDATIMKLASVFASDIDYVFDLREGDRFTLIYEEMWRDGEKLAEGEVLAAEFVNQGKTHRAIRYQTSDGRVSYYTPDGRGLRKAFLRAPLAFSRVSSDFNPRRRHPILNTIRAHAGVDYAAPTAADADTPAAAEDAPGLGVTVYVPPKAEPASERFTSADFTLNEEGSAVTCPAGETSQYRQRDTGRHAMIFRFTRATCDACPLKQQCVANLTKGPFGRSVTKNDYEAEYQLARERAKAAEYAAVRRRHPAVERKLNELMNHHGGRRARYWGRAKVQMQQLMTGFVVNAKRILTLFDQRHQHGVGETGDLAVHARPFTRGALAGSLVDIHDAVVQIIAEEEKQVDGVAQAKPRLLAQPLVFLAEPPGLGQGGFILFIQVEHQPVQHLPAQLAEFEFALVV